MTTALSHPARIALAAALLATVLMGGFFVGALRTIVEDTGPDW